MLDKIIKLHWMLRAADGENPLICRDDADTSGDAPGDLGDFGDIGDYGDFSADFADLGYDLGYDLGSYSDLGQYGNIDFGQFGYGDKDTSLTSPHIGVSDLIGMAAANATAFGRGGNVAGEFGDWGLGGIQGYSGFGIGPLAGLPTGASLANMGFGQQADFGGRFGGAYDTTYAGGQNPGWGPIATGNEYAGPGRSGIGTFATGNEYAGPGRGGFATSPISVTGVPGDPGQRSSTHAQTTPGMLPGIAEWAGVPYGVLAELYGVPFGPDRGGIAAFAPGNEYAGAGRGSSHATGGGVDITGGGAVAGRGGGTDTTGGASAGRGGGGEAGGGAGYGGFDITSALGSVGDPLGMSGGFFSDADFSTLYGVDPNSSPAAAEMRDNYNRNVARSRIAEAMLKQQQPGSSSLGQTAQPGPSSLRRMLPVWEELGVRPRPQVETYSARGQRATVNQPEPIYETPVDMAQLLSNPAYERPKVVGHDWTNYPTYREDEYSSSPYYQVRQAAGD
jgi:hypothetical protein